MSNRSSTELDQTRSSAQPRSGRHVRTIPFSKRVRSVTVAVSVVMVAAVASAHYRVQPGDTLSGIANDHGVSVRALAEANGIADPDLIRVGQLIDVPDADSAGSTGSAGGGAVTGSTYIVRAGDTLGAIAFANGTTVTALVASNHIINPNRIRIGQRLTIPGASSSTSTPTATSTMHIVSAGETLGGIAARYGVRSSAIIDANDLRDPNRIRIGQRLTIPGVTQGGGGATPPTITCPLPGAIFINDWGFPRTGGRFHQGTDMFAPRGTKVRAPADGEVEAVSGTVGGLQFWLTGDDGRLYIGTHLDRFGQVGRVEAGDIVGAVGDTGNAKGAKTHLHFEIMVDGENVNPFSILDRSCR